MACAVRPLAARRRTVKLPALRAWPAEIWRIHMRIVDIVGVLNAQHVTGEYGAEDEISTAFGADLMSDALAFVDPDTLILTGMVNSHVLRTAEMLEVRFLMFVRGKTPDEELVELADELNIVLFRTEYTMFEACGLLYKAGLRGCTRNKK